MGGHVGGAVASSKAVEGLIEFFQKDTHDNPIQALDHALSFANEQIYAATMIQPELKGMGTTAVALLIRNNECFIAHVGDSRIYLFSDGKLHRLTKDHSNVQTLVDANIIADEDAENHPNKNQILQALGIAPVVKSTVCSSPILPKRGDVFLLCSDGLNGMVNDREMERLMNQNPLEDWPQVLINAALEAGGKDNVTASLIEITESTNTSSSFVDFNPKTADDLDKTREVSIDDVNRSSVISDGTNKSKKRMYIFAAVGFFVSLMAFSLMFIFGKSEEPVKVTVQPPVVKPQVKDSVLTGDSLKKLLNLTQCDSLNLLKLNQQQCKFQEDTIFRDTCSGFNSEIEVKNSVITVRIVRFLKTNDKEYRTLGAIVKAFNKDCSKLELSDIIEYNISNNTELDSQSKKLLKEEKIGTGWKILCPPCK
jgi:serine/threonine protein phosphatase PrpC